MKITQLHRNVAEALYTERATAADIRARFRIRSRTLGRWQAEPAFQALLAEIEARHRRRARWLFVTFAEVAAARLVKLTEADSAETARKACLDVLAKADLTGDAAEAAQAQTADVEALDADIRRRIYELLAARLEPTTGAPPSGEKSEPAGQVAPPVAAKTEPRREAGPAARPDPGRMEGPRRSVAPGPAVVPRPAVAARAWSPEP